MTTYTALQICATRVAHTPPAGGGGGLPGMQVQMQPGYVTPPQIQPGYVTPPSIQGGSMTPPQFQAPYVTPPVVQQPYMTPPVVQAPVMPQAQLNIPPATLTPKAPANNTLLYIIIALACFLVGIVVTVLVMKK